MAKVMSHIEAHFFRKIPLEELARLINISTDYLEHLFKQETGTNCKEYIIQVRMRRAGDLLRNTDYTVDELSRQVGYDNPNYVSSLFKKKRGLTPLEYRAGTPR
jgi:two-component system response regulator YesN